MADSLEHELIDAIYRTPLEPGAWSDVMALMRRRFPSEAQTFYFLHRDSHRVQPVCLAGVAPRWVDSFNALYFSPDNPWIRLTEQLHRPGVVRTNERLDHVLHTPGSLYGSAYYNEWMRPQRFRYTIGSTLTAESDLVANITLLRSPEMKTFSASEVRAFERLSGHMTRALQLANHLGRPQACPAVVSALDAMPQPIALVEASRRILHANAAMESLLRNRHGLASVAGVLQAADLPAQQVFVAWFARAAAVATLAGEASDPLSVPCGNQRPVTVNAIPLVARHGGSAWEAPTLLLVVSPPQDRLPPSEAEIRRRYGCTGAEARLARHLAQGRGVREAARELGITYGTARDCLKAVFDKFDVHSQAQLVAQLCGNLPVEAPCTPT